MSEDAQELTRGEYEAVLTDVVTVLEAARRQAARSVNALLTAAYWEIGRRIVEGEQAGQARADYGERLIERLSQDLTARFGRGFGRRNLFQMRAFALAYSPKVQTVSAQLDAPGATGKAQTLSAESSLDDLGAQFPLSWSHYVRLLSVKSDEARRFYEQEAQARGGRPGGSPLRGRSSACRGDASRRPPFRHVALSER